MATTQDLREAIFAVLVAATVPMNIEGILTKAGRILGPGFSAFEVHTVLNQMTEDGSVEWIIDNKVMGNYAVYRLSPLQKLAAI
jgi:hypothetical protein